MNVETKDAIAWKTINKMFNDNPDFLIKHHLDSYNQFFNKGIQEIFKNNNPLTLFKDKDADTGIYKHNLEMYFGGKEGNKIYYGKPIIYDEDHETTREHYMFPNEARLRNMSYEFTIHYDIDVEFTIYTISEVKSGLKGMDRFDKKEFKFELKDKYLGKFPIMLLSDRCVLKDLHPEVRFNMGECRNDNGGYFIIDGKEKAIVAQDNRANNVLYIVKNKPDNKYSHAAEIRSVSENTSKPQRTFSVRIVEETGKFTNKQIVVFIPNVRKPIPLFILMRALGVISDKDIIETCLLDLDKHEDLIDLFRPSVHDTNLIFTQQAALEYIALLTKQMTKNVAMYILMDYLLPHIGELNFKSKSLFIGYIVKKLLLVYVGREKPTNRDKYSYKRIEITGMLLHQVFREYYIKQWKAMRRILDLEYFWKQKEGQKGIYQGTDFQHIIENKSFDLFKTKIVAVGIRKAFKGDWGSEIHTKKAGIVQDLTRLSYFSKYCQMRKTNLNIGDAVKQTGPRLLNGTQHGIICPLHTPSGGNCGLHKHIAISTHITSGESPLLYIPLLRSMGMKILEECSIEYISKYTKIFINGGWIGIIEYPIRMIKFLRIYKRNNIIDKYTCLNFDYKYNEIQIYCDAGRPCRPLFYMDDGDLSYTRPDVLKKYINNTITWKNIVNGFGEEIEKYKLKINPLQQSLNETDEEQYDEWHMELIINSSVIEYIDALEGEGTVLAHSQNTNLDEYIKNRVTHEEIHPSLYMGIMANMIIFPEHNPLPRNAFACGQAKQAVSVYHTNYRNRMDKSAMYLNYGQSPLTKSRYWNYITNDEHPYGENTIVAIMCYTGFNVEDAVILNRGALERGLFSTTKYEMYETFEEIENIEGVDIKTVFLNIEQNNVIRKKPGYDYSKLDKATGLIKEGSIIDDKTILIGKATDDPNEFDQYIDASIVPKKGSTGVVDKAFITSGLQGKRIAKIRIRSQRMPAIGDKFCSRAGQKGTVGIILDEVDMPTTEDGLKPDLIVNPHAMPSRMTIGHLVETLTSKVASLYGGYGDCTAFINKGSKHKMYGEHLMKFGFERNGHDILYNGMSGEQLEADIYIGPTYYLRLKHMPKDKINYRARGPRTVLTRQTVGGRANDGGLRIGEMDRDCVLAYGMSGFMKQSMMVRGDEFKVAICNQSGCISAYNENKNIFLSPFADGPIKFKKNVNNDLNIININKHGRSFSIVNVPYAFKLLTQELQGLNIQTRIITDDNIDQLFNSPNSREIELRFGKEQKMELLATKIKQKQNISNGTLFREKEAEKIEENPFEDYGLADITQQQWNQPHYTETSFFSNEGDWGVPEMGMEMGMGVAAPGSGFGTQQQDDELIEEAFIEEPSKQQKTWHIGDRVQFRDDDDVLIIGDITHIEDDDAIIQQEDGDVEITELENLERAHSPAFRPSSPDYNPERPPSPVYVPGASSPAYNPERPPSPVYVPGPSSTLKEYGNDPWKTEKAVTDSDSESEDEEKPPIIIHHGEHDNSDLKMLSSVDDLEKDVEDMAENDKKITFNP
jgi:DNA-directed RNA polymerase II subunit RPB2